MPRGKSVRTARAREVFAETLATTCNVSEACRAAGIGRATAYAWRDDDPVFAQAWEDAEEEAADKLEQVAFERASGGQSDRMLEILLKAHRPKYREKHQMQHSFDLSGLNDEELEQLARLQSRITNA